MTIIVVQTAFTYTFAYTDVSQQPELVGSSYEEETNVGQLYARIGTAATSPQHTSSSGV